MQKEKSLILMVHNNNYYGKVYNKPCLHNLVLVLVNFSTVSYRAEVNATNIVVRVMAFGSFDTPFLVEVIPDTVLEGS